ncbi:hypothetical protein E4U24_007113 [Claviceps purpurea]|nr:hypothetical protein E4U24_007113 [Claviceps purpurea]
MLSSEDAQLCHGESRQQDCGSARIGRTSRGAVNRVGSSNGLSASQSSPVAVHLEKQEEKHGEEENDASLDFYFGGFVPGPEFTE